ncbi:MAG: hypothetical protein EP330_16225 [Deltaproteobacteria bacterium]|nr:MAG: hypothetical protein EP330_16225 [Deltaproteobacteria bacterium]
MFDSVPSLILVLALTACGASEPGFAERAASASSAAFTVPQSPVVEARYEVLATSERGRRFADHAFMQREEVRFIEGVIAARGLPPQLEAVAFVESGFDNVPARPEEYPAAGVWQFIPSTARAYGLRVDGEVDERMDPEKSTAAALDLLTDLHASFGDWPAAIAAYNVGEKHLRAVMAEQGTTDVWLLIERGALPTYAADVMAAAAMLED